jgi:hypothetical protein
MIAYTELNELKLFIVLGIPRQLVRLVEMSLTHKRESYYAGIKNGRNHSRKRSETRRYFYNIA